MTKVTIFSGFLGAGKTTLIKKLIGEVFEGERLVLIENEFGEIGVDSGFLADAGIAVTEMNSGCICCSLVGDFGQALLKVLEEYHPDRILIEPSGVGKLSDVIRAVEEIDSEDLSVAGAVTVVDAAKCRMHLRNFGEFFGDQVTSAGTVILSHTKGLSADKLMATVEAVRSLNSDAVIVTTDWEHLTGAQILAAVERTDTLAALVDRTKAEERCPVCGHAHEHHHHHHHDEDCDCHGHHHHHDEDCDCHGHHHHHDENCDCHGHHHHHDENCCCEHDHHGHGHHHADDVFVSCGAETAKQFCREELSSALLRLSEEESFGTVLRAKGIVAGEDGTFLHFDYVPGEPDVRTGSAAIIGRLCVIGAKLNVPALSALFGVELK